VLAGLYDEDKIIMIRIEIKGLENLQQALLRFPKMAGKYLYAAGQEAARGVILPTEGLQKYPPATEANFLPTPYYIRGRGMQRAGIRKPAYNDGKSERYGTQWTVTPYRDTAVKISNRASYAVYLAGEKQARKTGEKGWRILAEVANEKIEQIKQVYQAWIDKWIREQKGK